MPHITRRRLSTEFMDDPHVGREDLTGALRFLQIVNARLGGTSAALWHFKRWSRQWSQDQTIRILDVGTGAADIPIAIADWAASHGFRVHVTGIDLHPTTVAVAREIAGDRTNIAILQFDALKLMDAFHPGEFDYAHAGLFLHHLPDLHVMTVLRIMDRLAKRGLIWNDLVRGWIGAAGVRLMTMGKRVPEMVRHDAIVSVQAGFTKAEALELATRAGIEGMVYRRHLGYRFTLTSNKPGVG